MSDRLIAWVRTVVPGAWAAFVTWLVGLGLPAEAGEWLYGAAEVVIMPAALGIVYAAIRWVEPHLPAWLARLLAGSTNTPTYTKPQRHTLTGTQ